MSEKLKKQLSNYSDEQKIEKNDYPRPRMSEKLKKQLSNPLEVER